MDDWSEEVLRATLQECASERPVVAIPIDPFYECWWRGSSVSRITPEGIVTAWRLFSSELVRCTLRPSRTLLERSYAANRAREILEDYTDSDVIPASWSLGDS
jgi:hypothetical protein